MSQKLRTQCACQVPQPGQRSEHFHSPTIPRLYAIHQTLNTKLESSTAKGKGNSMYRRKFVKLTGASLACLALTACGGQEKDAGPDYADDEAMSIIAKGFKARSDFLNSSDYTGSDADLKEAIQKEIDCDSVLKERQFEDSTLHELVLSYLNSLDDQLDVLNNYSSSSVDYYTAWEKVYDERSTLLKTMVEEYDLTVDESCQDALDEIVANGNNASKKADVETSLNAIINGATFEVADSGYGWYEYTTVLENTTDYNFSDISFVVALYDENGVKDTELYASTQGWQKGEKVKFDAGSAEISTTNIKATLEYYTLDE